MTEPGPLPGSLVLLCSAHDLLGQKSACTMEQGKLLNYIVDVLVPLLTAEQEHPLAEQLCPALEQVIPPPYYPPPPPYSSPQAVFCLYAHPTKKSRTRHLVDHNVSQIGLKWERALVLYSYVKPRKLPEHDIKTSSISLDTENLLRRIVALVPDWVQVGKCASVYLCIYEFGIWCRWSGGRPSRWTPLPARPNG